MYRSHRYDDCLKEVRKKLKQSSNSLHLLNYQAMAYSALKKDKDALLSYKKIIKQAPSLAGPYYNMGIILKRNGRVEEAIESYTKAISLKPDYVQAYNNLGVLYKDNEKYENAIKMFTKAKDLQPNHQNSYYNLALIKNEQGLSEEAIELFFKVLELNSEHNDAKIYATRICNELGRVYRKLGKIEKSLSCHNKAIKINPENPKNYYNIAITLREAERIKEAEENYRKAILLDPKHIGSYHNLALIHQYRGQIKEGLSIAKEVLKFETNHPDINHSIGVMSLQIGLLAEGWKYNEYRWKTSPLNKLTWPLQDKSIWKGEKGKRVVVWKEQGLGDQIIFLSLVPEVKEMCDTLSVFIDPRLQSLCKRTMPDIHFIADEKALNSEDCDFHLPLGSVPGLIRNDISDFDRTVRGYLKADPVRVEAIRKELKLKGKTVIGISWKSFNSLNQAKKSVQLKDMERIFSGLDVVLVNLQYGDVEDEIREFKEATGIDVVQCASVDNREDLDGLAALIEVCDLVVSTSNVTVHLAGALAKETWVLLHYVSVYYWLEERKDSIWYPSLSLYRQPTLDDWDSVYTEIRKDLEMRFLCD